jgi:hypothetical protein
VKWKEYEIQQQQQQQLARAKRVRDESEASMPSKKAKLSTSDLCLNDEMDLVEPVSLEQQPMSIDQSQVEDDLCLEGSTKRCLLPMQHSR